MDFATNFKRICSERGTSPTTVCKELGLSTSKVNLWNGGSLPKQELLVVLAKHLNCSVMDFFADENYLLHNENENDKECLDEDEHEILRLFRLLSLKEKHMFMAQAYAYEDKLTNEKE